MKSTTVFIVGLGSLALAGCADMFRDEDRQAGAPPPREQPIAQERQQAAPEQQAPEMAASDRLIRDVQQALQAKGIDPGPVDGIWGPQTHQAVQQFQQAQGLETTGQLNGRTLGALGIAGEQQASAGGSASAGTSAGADQLFERVDKDNDGRVSREEFAATFGAERSGDERTAGPPSFKHLDANDDGYLSLAEAGADTRISRDFKRADRDNDWRLSREEFQAALEMEGSASAGATSPSRQAR